MHDFRLFKESKIRLLEKTNVVTDSGYLGIQKIHGNSRLPKKKTKNKPLAAEEKKQNKELSKERVYNEHVIGKIKRFKIVAERYRNRRKRFSLRFNLVAGIYNYELENNFENDLDLDLISLPTFMSTSLKPDCIYDYELV